MQLSTPEALQIICQSIELISDDRAKDLAPEPVWTALHCVIYQKDTNLSVMGYSPHSVSVEDDTSWSPVPGFFSTFVRYFMYISSTYCNNILAISTTFSPWGAHFAHALQIVDHLLTRSLYTTSCYILSRVRVHVCYERCEGRASVWARGWVDNISTY